MSAINYSEFKGQPMMEINRNEEDRFPFRFGQTKAKLIVEHFNAIKRFAETGNVAPAKSNGKPKSKTTKTKTTGKKRRVAVEIDDE